jgi:hypothetical protein
MTEDRLVVAEGRLLCILPFPSQASSFLTTSIDPPVTGGDRKKRKEDEFVCAA